MPRQPRSTGDSGYMHVIIRGLGKQILFEDEEDHLFYLKKLKKYSMQTKVRIVAFCLMSNHVHMLVHDPQQTVALLMKKVEVSYAGYYNKKYDRTGHLFQNRYISEPVEDERYFLTAFRYILRNPEKAGVCRTADYRWSSYKAYYARDTFVELDQIRHYLPTEEDYRHYLTAENADQDECLEYDTTRDDDWAINVARSILQASSATIVQKYEKESRNDALRKLRRAGLTIRQIERITGINRGVIYRATKT